MAKPVSNLLDRAIATVSPRWALNRAKDRALLELSGGYFGGGRRTRPGLANWNPGASDADADISPDLVDLRAYSRDLARRSPLAGGAISTVVTNVVGTGLSAQPAPDAAFLGLSEDEAAAWIEQATREYELWCDSTDCDLTRTQDFYGLQSLAFRSALESGDVFAIPTMAGPGRPYHLAIQLIEADRACNPGWKADSATLVAGVEMDGNGAPAAYHFSNTHPGARQRAGMTWTRVDAFNAASGRRNVLHLLDRRRPGQTRGVPYLTPVIEPLKQLTRYSEAEISAAVISAAFAVFVKMDADAFQTLFEGENSKKYIDTAIGWNGSVPTADMDAPSKAVNLLPGEDIVAPELGRPNTAFDPFVTAVLRQIGVGLELPFEVLVKHFTSSYSAARAALLDAWRFFRGRRDWLAGQFCQPIYELWLEEAVASGRVRAPGFFADPAWRRAWSRAVWIGDAPGAIDPVKEVTAAKERIAQGISTIAAESILHDGSSWDVKHRQRVREETARRAGGLTTNPNASSDSPDDEDDIPDTKPSAPDSPVKRRRTASADLLAAMPYAIGSVMAQNHDTLAGTLNQRISALIEELNARFTASQQVPQVHVNVAAPEAPNVSLEAIHHHHIAVAAAESPAVQKMEIVAMPVRETTTDIERNEKNEIVKSTQIEKDA